MDIIEVEDLRLRDLRDYIRVEVEDALIKKGLDKKWIDDDLNIKLVVEVIRK